MASHHEPSPREAVAELFGRLAHVQAATVSLRSLTDLQSTAPALLADALRGLERDLRLAASEAHSAAARMAAVNCSPRPRSPVSAVSSTP